MNFFLFQIHNIAETDKYKNKGEKISISKSLAIFNYILNIFGQGKFKSNIFLSQSSRQFHSIR